MVEISKRYGLDGGFTFRGYVDLGASVQSNDRSFTTASIIGASSANGGFQSYSTSSPLLGRLDLGLQLIGAKRSGCRDRSFPLVAS